MREGSERFGRGKPLAVDVCGGCGLLSVDDWPIVAPTAIRPELAHRNIAAAEILQAIHRHRLRIARAGGFALVQAVAGVGQCG